MGLWLKKDGEFVPVSGGGGDAGPHDHDYLPLEGGTVAGDLEVDGTVATSNPGSEGAPAFASTLYPTTGMYGHAEGVFFAVDGQWKFGAWADRVGIRHDLQVDGNADLKINVPADFWSRTSGTVFNDLGMVGGSQGSYAMSMTCNGYRNNSNGWTSLGLNGQAGATEVLLFPTGLFEVRTNATRDPNVGASTTRFSVADSGTKANGDLEVVGIVKGSSGHMGQPSVCVGGDGSTSGMYGGSSGVAFSVNGAYKLNLTPDLAVFTTNTKISGGLEVTDAAHVKGNARIDGVIHSPGTFANSGGGGANLHVTSSGYFFRSGTRGGAFAPSKLTRDSDVLERAETATLPPEIETDDDGNQTNTAEVEAHDTVQLFDVVTALLLKVKELSATVADQTEKIAALEAN